MQIFQVDAFAKENFQGNPAAVIPLKEWLPDELLQKIAMENNLSETVYFVPEGRDFSIRWFTPAVEVDLCGHATLASGHVLFEYLGFTGDKIVFHSRKSGDLEVFRGWGEMGAGGKANGAGAGRLTLNFPSQEPQPVDPGPLSVIFDGLGIPSRPLFKGPYDYMVVLDNQQAVEALEPDFRRLAASPGRGVVVTARGDAADFVSRCFFPQSGIDEDPVTGSAHTMLVPYWARQLGKNSLSAIQLSARRGWLDCELDGGRVFMSGYAKTFMKGEILL
jgi:PhzF family phenazine biosynthesis protein